MSHSGFHLLGLRKVAKFFAFFFLLSIGTEVFGQVYEYTFKDNKLELFAALLAHGSIQIYDQLRPVSLLDDDVTLDPSEIWSFDRSAVDQNSEAADDWSDAVLYASISGPLLLGFRNYENDNYGNILLMGLQGYLLQDALTNIVKIVAQRPRPYLYNVEPDVARMYQTKTDTKSFYSGHTSTAAYLSFFTAKVYSDLYPESKFKALVWSTAAMAPALTGYFRYKAGKHFPTDAITGYIVGASFGLLLPKIYRKENINITPSISGLAIEIKF